MKNTNTSITPPPLAQLKPANPVLSHIIERYGLLIGGMDLARLLGYPTTSALSQAIYRGSCPVPVTKVQGRHGYFATADDIAELVMRLKEGEREMPVRELLG
jgi:hypothetical protein